MNALATQAQRLAGHAPNRTVANALRGKDAFICEELAHCVDLANDWHTRFWMGGWDGDLLVGWMSGSDHEFLQIFCIADRIGLIGAVYV
jgi:hypothetical protein